MRIGYARISTGEQDLALQVDALEGAGCERIYCDRGISGAARDRPALDKALAALRADDVLVTWKLDRLGRSLAHLIEIVAALEGRGIGFESLSEAIATTTAGGRLTFHILGALAEFERSLISERTKAGIAAARARGVTVGRPRKLREEQVLFAVRELAAGRATLADLAARFGVSTLTLSRALARQDATS